MAASHKLSSQAYYEFLSATLTGTQPPSLADSLQHPGWTWDAFIKLASDELILPLVAPAILVSAPFTGGRSPDASQARDALCSARCANAERNQVILDELQEVGRLANEIGIEPIALKGCAHLLGKLYSDLPDRYLLDIDLLIPESRIGQLVDHLYAHGYAPLQKMGLDCHHEAPMQRPGKPVIELHRRVGRGRCRILLPAAEVIRDSISFDHQGVSLRIPSDEHIFLHHVLHAQLGQSYAHALWPSLRDAYDCLLLTRRLIHSEELFKVWAAFEQRHASQLVALHLLTVNQMLGGSVPVSNLAPFSLLNLRWLHRRLQRSSPRLSHFYPYFWLRSSLLSRLSRLDDLRKTHLGRLYILQTPFRRSFYRNLRGDLF